MATPIDNRNFLAPTGFKFALKRSPGVAFFCNEANIPDLNLGIAVQPTYLKDIDRPGDKIQFGDLTIRFLVDEDLTNFMEIQNWIRGLGFPESLDEFAELESKGVVQAPYEKSENSLKLSGNPNPRIQFCISIKLVSSSSTRNLIVRSPN